MEWTLPDLPEEIIETIAEHLSLKDVQACNQVSRSWRTAFNNNRIWRRFCTFHPKYFIKQKSKLGYSSEDDCEGCEAKQQVFKELLVQRNLCENKIHLTQVSSGLSIVFCFEDAVDEEGNHWMVLIGETKLNDFQLQVWNLRDEPYLQSSVCLPNEIEPFDRITINNGKLFYFFHQHVLVYSFCQPQYHLQFLFELECPNVSTPFSTNFCHINDLVLCFFWSPNITNHFPNVCVWDEEGSVVFESDGIPIGDWQEKETLSQSHSVEIQCGSSDKVLLSKSFNGLRTKYAIALFSVLNFEYTIIFKSKEHLLVEQKIIFGNNVFLLRQKHYKDVGKTVKSGLRRFKSNGTIIFDYLAEVNVQLHLYYGKNKIVITEDKSVCVMDVVKDLIVESNRFFVDCNYDCGCAFDFSTIILNENFLCFRNCDGENNVWDMRSGCKIREIKGFILDLEWHLLEFKFLESYRSPPKIITKRKVKYINVISFW